MLKHTWWLLMAFVDFEKYYFATFLSPTHTEDTEKTSTSTMMCKKVMFHMVNILQ